TMGLLMLYLASSGSMKDVGLALGILKPYAVVTNNQLLCVICTRAGDFIFMPSTQAS
ncbi:hypothetical protein F441_07716, partial [Phytophthora nicotianae CJ01A1]